MRAPWRAGLHACFLSEVGFSLLVLPVPEALRPQCFPLLQMGLFLALGIFLVESLAYESGQMEGRVLDLCPRLPGWHLGQPRPRCLPGWSLFTLLSTPIPVPAPVSMLTV